VKDAQKQNARKVIAASDLADTKKNVAYALAHLDGVSPDLAIKLASNGVTADSLRGMGLDALTGHYGLSVKDADKVMKGAAKGLPDGIEAELDFVPVSTDEGEEGGDDDQEKDDTRKRTGKSASKKGK
jgi:hypothetical protein